MLVWGTNESMRCRSQKNWKHFFSITAVSKNLSLREEAHFVIDSKNISLSPWSSFFLPSIFLNFRRALRTSEKPTEVVTLRKTSRLSAVLLLLCQHFIHSRNLREFCEILHRESEKARKLKKVFVVEIFCKPQTCLEYLLLFHKRFFLCKWKASWKREKLNFELGWSFRN